MFSLLNVVDQLPEEGASGPSARAGKPLEEAVDLAKAFFAAGATPGEARAIRVWGLGVLPAGAF
eukprot:3082877-Alexandrium_andersonii.AAC.1